MIMASTNMGALDKPTQEQIQQLQQQQQQQQQQQKCPRCDSSNTKFCYYNNYSLSQPRHFCKACKRYWTRGGTLRNVPVGGGCRKHKRIKRPAASTSASVAVDSSPSSSSLLSHPMATIKLNNPLFYQPNSSINPNSSEFNLSFNSRVDHVGSHHHHHHQFYEYDNYPPQIISSTLGFSSSSSDLLSKSILSSYNHLPNFGSFSSSTVSNAPPTIMSSFLSPNLQQQKIVGDTRAAAGGSTFLGFSSQYEDDMQMQGSRDLDVGTISMKELKAEESQNRMNNINQIQQMRSADPESLFWNLNGSAASWLDPANSVGSSVPSLI